MRTTKAQISQYYTISFRFLCFHHCLVCSVNIFGCCWKNIWTASSEFGTYRLCEQRRFVCLFVCLCWGLTSQSTIFQSCRDGATASWVINQYFRGVKCLAQGHNTAAVGIEPPTSRSGVRHSTTEPPRSPEQRRFRRACASVQSRQNLRCSLIQAVNQEEPSDRKPDPWSLWMAGHAQLKFVMTECSKTQIRLTGLILYVHAKLLLHHLTSRKQGLCES